jgi:hypothetical protein
VIPSWIFANNPIDRIAFLNQTSILTMGKESYHFLSYPEVFSPTIRDFYLPTEERLVGFSLPLLLYVVSENTLQPIESNYLRFLH